MAQVNKELAKAGPGAVQGAAWRVRFAATPRNFIWAFRSLSTIILGLFTALLIH